MLARPATATGVIPDSVPPVRITSASSRWIMWYASMKAWMPDAQAAAEVIDGP